MCVKNLIQRLDTRSAVWAGPGSTRVQHDYQETSRPTLSKLIRLSSLSIRSRPSARVGVPVYHARTKDGEITEVEQR